MPVDVSSTLREALSKLSAEKRRIERQAAAVQDALRAVNGANDGQRSSSARVLTRGAKRGRRRMSPAERKAVARRMKAYWAKGEVGRVRERRRQPSKFRLPIAKKAGREGPAFAVLELVGGS